MKKMKTAVVKRTSKTAKTPEIKQFFKGELSAEAYVEAVRVRVRHTSAARQSRARVRYIQEKALSCLAKAE